MIVRMMTVVVMMVVRGIVVVGMVMRTMTRVIMMMLMIPRKISMASLEICRCTLNADNVLWLASILMPLLSRNAYQTRNRGQDALECNCAADWSH